MNDSAQMWETSRRTLVRAAWTAPLVATAVAAPAFAASTTMPSNQVTIVEASYYWHEVPSKSTWLMAPRITIRNDGPSTTTDLSVSVTFPAEFVGRRPDGTPFIYNVTGANGWGYRQVRDSGTGKVTVTWGRPDADGVAKGVETTLGDWSNSGNPWSGIEWKSNVVADLWVTTRQTGYVSHVSSFVNVSHPT